jgi:hypothetical protein
MRCIFSIFLPCAEPHGAAPTGAWFAWSIIDLLEVTAEHRPVKSLSLSIQFPAGNFFTTVFVMCTLYRASLSGSF